MPSGLQPLTTNNSQNALFSFKPLMTFHVLFLCLESFLLILSTCQGITYSPLLGLCDVYSQRECWEATGVPGTCQWRKSYHWSPVRCWGPAIFWQASLRWRACPWMAPTELYCHVPQTLVSSPSSQSSGPVCCLHWENSEASIQVVSEILQAKNWHPTFSAMILYTCSWVMRI